MESTFTFASLSETRKSLRFCFVLRLGETELRASLNGIGTKRVKADVLTVSNSAIVVTRVLCLTGHLPAIYPARPGEAVEILWHFRTSSSPGSGLQPA